MPKNQAWLPSPWRKMHAKPVSHAAHLKIGWVGMRKGKRIFLHGDGSHVGGQFPIGLIQLIAVTLQKR